MSNRPTPDTDSKQLHVEDAWREYQKGEREFRVVVPIEIARKLERERDEAREALSGRTVSCLQCNEAAAKLATVYRWIERNHPDGFIDSQSHLQNLDRVADAWHDKLEAMRGAIREAHDALKQWPKAGHGMSTDFTKQSEAFCKGQAALVKLQTFLKP